MTSATTLPCASRKSCAEAPSNAHAVTDFYAHLLDQPASDGSIRCSAAISRSAASSGECRYLHANRAGGRCQSIRLLARAVQHALRLRRRRGSDRFAAIPATGVRSPIRRVPWHRTRTIAKLKCGDLLGVRGPFGSSWPINAAIGRCRACRQRHRLAAAAVLDHLLRRRAKPGMSCYLWRAHTGRSALRSPVGRWVRRREVHVTDRATGVAWRY